MGGPACDLLGPRASSATLSLLTAPAVLAASIIRSPTSFILVRFLVGFSLANFVSNQFWMSSMFSGNVVGVANGVSAGWANVGSGATQLLMPLIFSFITNRLHVPSSAAWRLAFVVPATLQAATGILVLAFGQDKPSKASNVRKVRKQKFLETLFRGIRDYRGWVLALTYGFCFGVELTVDNVIAQYFYDRFGVELTVAGAIAASFGMANCVSRPAGGMLSDELGRRFGMRGRLWGLWAVQLVAALLCVLLGRVNSLWGSIVVMCCFSFFVQAAASLSLFRLPRVSPSASSLLFRIGY